MRNRNLPQAHCGQGHRVSSPCALIRVAVMGLMAVVMSAGAGVAAAAETPTEAVKRTIAEVMHILGNEELRQPSRAAERRQEIEQVVRHRVSYEEMSKRSLGLRWYELSLPERQEFVDLFVELSRDTFAGKINAYTDEQIAYLSEERAENMAEVRTILSGRKTDTRLDFRLADRFGNWRVYDVVIDGASIVGNYRAQFTSLIREVSYAGLLERLRAKALVVKAFERPAAP